MTVGVARLSLFVLDCPEPRALADFYAAVTGWDVDEARSDWVELRSAHGASLAFQRAPDYRAPDWPGNERPQQAHLDFDVPDLDVGEAQVLSLGARKAHVQPGETFRVFLDPVGHPFCLVHRPDLDR